MKASCLGAGCWVENEQDAPVQYDNQQQTRLNRERKGPKPGANELDDGDDDEDDGKSGGDDEELRRRRAKERGATRGDKGRPRGMI